MKHRMMVLLAATASVMLAAGGSPRAYGQPPILEHIAVPVDGSSIASRTVLQAGLRYRLRASGATAVGGDMTLDAEYQWSARTGPMTACEWDPPDGCPVDMGIAVDNPVIDRTKPPFWGPYNPERTYEIEFIGKGAPLTLTLYDAYYPDNTGPPLTVEILSPCGDGTIDTGEECDDGNVNPRDGCTNACTLCGNGAVTAPEACDDGNAVDGDGCNADCGVPLCGDGILSGTEQCDDGNTVDGDCCSARCRWPVDIVTGPVVNPANGHRYYLLAPALWPQSEAAAECLGGHLATINDQAEENWVFDSFKRYGGVDRTLWIGLTDEASEGTFVWTSGEPVTYTNWGPGEPNNDGCCGNEDYVHIAHAQDPSLWNDAAGPEYNGVVELTDCGNGVLDPGEECEDGNLDARDGCTNWCTICGNGVARPPEQCDDGNRTNNDACSNACTARWVLTGPLGGPQGAPRALALDGQTVYAAFGGNGVYRSPDAGRTWRKADTGLPEVAVNALIVDPQTPGTVYAATEGDGVFRSPDGGATWFADNAGLHELTVRTLAMSTADARYAGTPDRLYRSDADTAWHMLTIGDAGKPNTIVIDPLSPSTLYVGTRNDAARAGMVFKSTDRGATWMMAGTGLPGLTVERLAVDPGTPRTLYAALSDHDPQDPWLAGVYKSTDGGVSWRRTSNGLPGQPNNPDPNVGRFLRIVIDPVTPTTLYVANIGSGVYKSTDGAASWRAVNTGISDLAVWDLALDATSPRTLYAAGNGTAYTTTDGGMSWKRASGLPGGMTAVAVDPVDPRVVYTGGTDAIHKSTDGGATFAPANSGLPGIGYNMLAVDPVAHDTVYAAVYFSTPAVYRSTDGGRTWSGFGDGLDAYAASSLAIDPTNPGRVYVGADQAAYGVYTIDLAPAPCTGDCNSDGTVTIAELIVLVNLALGTPGTGPCPADDVNGDGAITVNEIVAAVTRALEGCAGQPRICGGIGGLPCESDEVCDLRDPTCAIVDLAGTCVPRPQACVEIFDPVCGCDGVTYGNDCLRLVAGATLAHVGTCG